MARFETVADEALMAPSNSCGDIFFELGIMHATGRSGATDLVTAHQWFNLAALRGNQAAREYRAELAAEMSSADIAEAQRRAREWLTMH